MSDAIGTDSARTNFAPISRPTQNDVAQVDRPSPSSPEKQRDLVAAAGPAIDAAASAAKAASQPVRDPAMPAAANNDVASIYAPESSARAGDDAPTSGATPWSRAVDEFMADRMGGRHGDGPANWQRLQQTWANLTPEQRAQLIPRDDPGRMQRLLGSNPDPSLGAPNPGSGPELRQPGGPPSDNLELALRQTRDPAEAARRLAALAGVDPAQITLRPRTWETIARRADQIAAGDGTAGNQSIANRVTRRPR